MEKNKKFITGMILALAIILLASHFAFAADAVTIQSVKHVTFKNGLSTWRATKSDGSVTDRDSVYAIGEAFKPGVDAGTYALCPSGEFIQVTRAGGTISNVIVGCGGSIPSDAMRIKCKFYKGGNGNPFYWALSTNTRTCKSSQSGLTCTSTSGICYIDEPKPSSGDAFTMSETTASGKCTDYSYATIGWVGGGSKCWAGYNCA